MSASQTHYFPFAERNLVLFPTPSPLYPQVLLSLYLEKPAHSAAGLTLTPGSSPSLGLAPELSGGCWYGEWGVVWDKHPAKVLGFSLVVPQIPAHDSEVRPEQLTAREDSRGSPQDQTGQGVEVPQYP